MKYTKLMIALLAVLMIAVWGCERKVTNEIVQVVPGPLAGSEACMKCHGDTTLTFVVAQQGWKLSKHGIGALVGENRYNDISDTTCERCHTAEGFLGKITNTPVDTTHFSAIGCFTCHAPHTNGTLALRVDAPYTLLNGDVFDHGEANLCANCHHSRRDVRTYVADSVKLSTRYGPHYGNQGDMLNGSGGYEYAGYTYRNSAHTAVALNGCVDCHMAAPRNPELGGHTWNMAVGGEEGETQEITGCNNVHCHAGTVTDFDVDSAQTITDAYFDSLGHALVTAGLADFQVNVEDNDTGYVAKDKKIVKHKDSTGAVYNLMFIQSDRSEGVHNTKYALGLLKSSLNYIRTGDPNGVVGTRRTDNIYSSH